MTDEAVSDPLAAGGNSLEDTWCLYPLAVEGNDFLTHPEVTTPVDAAAFEASSFYQLQAAAMRKSFAFWNDPDEDVYEDPDE
jgi:hypothetical protein